MLLFPDLTLLDFAGPYEVFIRTNFFEVYTVAFNAGEIKAEGGLVIKADKSLENCPLADIVFVPGGKGINPLLTSEPYLQFLRKQGEYAQYITSVCTGSLLLAAAGLLTGYKATTHWRSLELLKMFKIETLEERVVIDRNRITGAGVSAGIDFALTLTALICGEDEAKLIQLALEYHPQPPFQSGSPAEATPRVLKRAREVTQALFESRREIIRSVFE